MTDEKFSILCSVVAIVLIFVELLQFSTNVSPFFFCMNVVIMKHLKLRLLSRNLTGKIEKVT